MLTRAEAMEIVLRAIAELDLEDAEDDEVIVYEERTVERDHVFGFYCNTKQFKETHNPRDGLLGLGPIIVNRRTGAVAICGPQYFPECVDEYEQKVAAGKW